MPPEDLFPGAGDRAAEALIVEKLATFENVQKAEGAHISLDALATTRGDVDGTPCWLRFFPAVALRRTSPPDSQMPEWSVESLLRDLRALRVPPNNAICMMERVLVGLNAESELALAAAYRCEGTSETLDVILRTWRHATSRGVAAPREVNALKRMSERIRICAAIATGVSHLHNSGILHGGMCTRSVRIGSDGGYKAPLLLAKSVDSI